MMMTGETDLPRPTTPLRHLLAAAILATLPACTGMSTHMPDDDAINAKVNAQIDLHGALRVDHIRIQTIAHIVYIDGFVDTDRERQEVEEIALGVPGVIKVVNTLSTASQRY